MSIGIKTIVACINAAIPASSTPLQMLQVSDAAQKLTSGQVYSVPCLELLPNASCNKGRMIYVTDKSSYRISDGISWTNDFKSINVITERQIYGVGSNGSRFIGDGTDVNRSSPVSVIGGFTDWCQVSAGTAHAVAVRTNGTAWAWGSASLGRLGDGTQTTKCSPVSVIGGFTDWCQVSAGRYHTAAIRTNGTAWSWGHNGQGRLGDGTTVDKCSPVSVVGGFTDWCQISASNDHTVAVRANGTAWAWGPGNSGMLGDGTTVSKSSPVSVIGGFTDWCQVSGGNAFSLGVRTNGTLWAWGQGANGVLGDGTTVAKSSPVSVIGGFTDWCQATAGKCNFAFGIRTNGSLWAWGYGNTGRLGTGIVVTTNTSPVSVVGGFTDWCQVAASDKHAVAVRTNGTLWAWGYNGQCQLGDGTNISRSSPVSVIGGITSWCQASAGAGATLAVAQLRKGF
jgi:alpha-tubulin suppressor-like RCC1 family protein